MAGTIPRGAATGSVGADPTDHGHYGNPVTPALLPQEPARRQGLDDDRYSER